jgi:hypothetical protein
MKNTYNNQCIIMMRDMMIVCNTNDDDDNNLYDYDDNDHNYNKSIDIILPG